MNQLRTQIQEVIARVRRNEVGGLTIDAANRAFVETLVAQMSVAYSRANNLALGQDTLELTRRVFGDPSSMVSNPDALLGRLLAALSTTQDSLRTELDTHGLNTRVVGRQFRSVDSMLAGARETSQSERDASNALDEERARNQSEGDAPERPGRRSILAGF